MLAAAAIVGAILLGVPFALAGGDDDKDRAQSAAAVETPPDQMLLEDGAFDEDPGTFLPEAEAETAGGTGAGQPAASSDPGGDEAVLPKEASGSDAAGSSDEAQNGGTDTSQSGVFSPSSKVQAEGPSSAPTKDESSPSQGNPPASQEEPSSSREDGPSPKPTPQPTTVKGSPATGISASMFLPHWETKTYAVANVASGACLVRQSSSRLFVMGACSAGVWQRYEVRKGVFLLKNTTVNRCLDTDNSQLYSSSCTPADTGQLWKMPTADRCTVSIVAVSSGRYVVGWNEGKTSLSPASAADANKRTWRLPGLVKGC